jgi:diaminopimelate epimerase
VHDGGVQLDFLKMQGCGEDVIVVDCFKQPLAVQADLGALARLALDRSLGIGGEALLLLGPGGEQRLSLRAFGPDGVEARPSGNAVRCAGRYACDSGLVSATAFAVETDGGAVRVQVVDSVNVRIDLGTPVAADTLAQIRESPASSFTRTIALEGRELAYVPVSVGEPFAVFFVPSFSFPVLTTARRIARHPGFPAATGIAFARVRDRESLKLRTWEAGRLTPSCAGAAAAVVAAVVSGFTDREVFVRMRCGDLFLEWMETDNRMRLTGPAAYVFTGSFPFEE